MLCAVPHVDMLKVCITLWCELVAVTTWKFFVFSQDENSFLHLRPCRNGQCDCRNEITTLHICIHCKSWIWVRNPPCSLDYKFFSPFILNFWSPWKYQRFHTGPVVCIPLFYPNWERSRFKEICSGILSIPACPLGHGGCQKQTSQHPAFAIIMLSVLGSKPMPRDCLSWSPLYALVPSVITQSCVWASKCKIRQSSRCKLILLHFTPKNNTHKLV